MKKVILFFVCCAIAAISFAQKENFDIINYTVPKKWKKDVGENTITYTIINNKTNTWCRINIVKSTISKGNIEDDFTNEWQELVVKSYNPTNAPQSNELQENKGWKIKAGGSKFVFNNNEAMVFLTTASGYDRCASIVATTNSQDYIKDIEVLLASVDLIKPEIVAVPNPTAADDKNSIIGTWGISVVVPYRSGTEGSAGSNVKQYTFNSNGTYTFYIKTFSYSVSKLLLTRETGTYQISGNTITISPQKSVIEAWSKKDGGDKWGSLLSTQNKILEKTTYSFSKHYFSGIQEWNLVLQADKETQRDGPFSNSTTFSKAWLYGIPCSECLIQLPEGKQTTTEVKTEPVQQTTNSNNTTLVGTWDINASEKTGYSSNNYMISGYVNRQYTFNANGTYTFYIKTYQMFSDKMFLNKEKGSYQINGDNVTIHPQKSELEAWSRQGSNDVWGKKLSVQNIPLEKVTYRFAKEYFSEMNEWKLFLKAGTQTKRDGNFNVSNQSNSWVYIICSPARPIIKLPGE